MLERNFLSEIDKNFFSITILNFFFHFLFHDVVIRFLCLVLKYYKLISMMNTMFSLKNGFIEAYIKSHMKKPSEWS